MNRSRFILAAALCAVCLSSLPLTHAFAHAGASGPGAHPRQEKGQEQSFPDQSSIDAKSAFPTVSAGDKHVKTALNASDLAGAGKLIGKKGAFTGTVSQVYSPRDHDIVILDFAQNYRSALTAIVKPDNYGKLPDLKGLVGKHVLVTGNFSAFEGRPQLEIVSPGQVKIVR